MTRLGLWILVLVTGSAPVVWFLSNQESNVKTGLNLNLWSDNHLMLPHRGSSEGMITTRRSLKERNSMPKSGHETDTSTSNLNLEDYPHFDPTPDSKAGIRHGPIEHGTPLIPYIPRPSPPASGPGHPAGSAPGPRNPPPDVPPAHV